MRYWNDENFIGLRFVSEESPFSRFGEYCRLREKGLRREALRELDGLIAEADGWSVAERREFVDWLMTTRERYPEVHHLVPQPLYTAVVVPTLEQWVGDAPDVVTPRRWLGVLRSDAALLQDALRLDAEDDVARQHLIRHWIRAVDYATHHLVEGQFIGDVDEAAAMLEAAKREAAQFIDSGLREQFSKSIESLGSLIGDWQQYRGTNQSVPFREWCESRGHDHGWWSIFYYDR